jgi:pentatricopeptide repeat protein
MNAVAYNVAIDSAAKLQDAALALRILAEMTARGVSPTHVTLSSAIHACARAAAAASSVADSSAFADTALQLLDQVMRCSFDNTHQHTAAVCVVLCISTAVVDTAYGYSAYTVLSAALQ